MDVGIRVSGGDEIAELAALWDWLRGERDLRGLVDAVRRPSAEGELGGAFDMLTVALGSGGAVAVLARSLTSWLSSRRPDVTLTVTGVTGRVQLDARHVKDTDVLPLIQEVLRGRDDTPTS
ncbi:effector-associated constant component EACC1 [Streptomyces acidiscabies]|uniref:Uncharacterized protein n=1 Tax=Streptomyces acidiscabies TaxID=42234 RepID=A0A0L0JEP2_9ACTN|nr:hypothetical protein [Streptomyces acidiscabies]KND23825.1 hypothetical protein IQ63_43650 [Streptomyces acidiscabies]